MKKLTPQQVRRLAAEAAHSVASPGSTGGDAHNIRTIEVAIVKALALERECTYEAALDMALATRKRRKDDQTGNAS